MRNLRWLPLSILAAALLPTAFFIWCATSTLKSHIRQTVVNDPEAGLSQNLSLLKIAVNQWGDNINSSAVHFSENENLKNFLSASPPSLAAFKIFGKKLSDSTKLPLIILTDKKGNLLYDNLSLPKPTPEAAPAKKQAKPKKTGPRLAPLNDFPGLDRAAAGNSLRGFFQFHGSLYNGSLVCVQNKGKNLGVIILASLVNDDFFRFLKGDTADNLVLYSAAQTWCSLPVPPPPMDFAGRMEQAPAGPADRGTSLDWNHASYLAGGLSLYGIDSKPIAYIAAFQPVKKTFTVEGSPLKSIEKQGRWFLLAGFLLALAASCQFMLPFNRSLDAIEQIKNGSFNVDLPLNRPDEWGIMARSLRDMMTGLKEKERVSLILGKVVSPPMARNILEANDLFALKGERREVTLLHADLRGFNTLSENMEPQALVESLNQYFTLINEIVFQQEGMLDKFIGDTAIALWGAPFIHEDKELRAVKAALEIQETLKDFNISRIKKNLPPFTIGIGIHTGLVVSGNLGSDKHSDYTVIGDPLHLASRLCAMAAPGQTVISAETLQKIKSLVKAKPLNPIMVKGSLEPLPTYEITGLA